MDKLHDRLITAVTWALILIALGLIIWGCDKAKDDYPPMLDVVDREVTITFVAKTGGMDIEAFLFWANPETLEPDTIIYISRYVSHKFDTAFYVPRNCDLIQQASPVSSQDEVFIATYFNGTLYASEHVSIALLV